MRAIYVEEISNEEIKELKAKLKSQDGFVVRRSQIILMSGQEKVVAKEIGKRIGQSDQQVRNVIHAFNQERMTSVHPKSRARKDDQRAFDDQAREKLRELMRQTPRKYGLTQSLWTLTSLATVSYEQGLTKKLVHFDTVRQTVEAMGIHWQKAKHWIISPDLGYKRKKSDEIG